MSRREFMERLAELLSDISEEEREEAVSYYETYFDDAGPEMEQKILKELGSPEQTAAEIKKGLLRADTGPEPEDSGQTGNSWRQGSGGIVMEQKKWSVGFVILLCILAVPVGIPLFAVLFSIIISVAAVLFSIIVAAFGVGAGLFLGGIVVAFVSFTGLSVNPAAALAVLGGGLFMFGIGILFLWGGVLVCRAFPTCLRILKRPFQRKSRKGEATV